MGVSTNNLNWWVYQISNEPSNHQRFFIPIKQPTRVKWTLLSWLKTLASRLAMKLGSSGIEQGSWVFFVVIYIYTYVWYIYLHIYLHVLCTCIWYPPHSSTLISILGDIWESYIYIHTYRILRCIYIYIYILYVQFFVWGLTIPSTIQVVRTPCVELVSFSTAQGACKEEICSCSNLYAIWKRREPWLFFGYL